MKKLIAAGLLVLSTFAFADNEVILVSDIDDTIKNSHVLDPDSTIANAFLPNNTFMGMPELYQSLLDDKKVDEVVYLSNAPKFLMYPFHHHFLKREGFPNGRLLLNTGLSNKTHKLNSLRKIIEKESPKELILIGDNGEHDTEVYGTIAKEYPDTKITTFIHQAYSQIGYHNNFGKLLEENQIGWATALDLSYELMNRDLLTEASYANVVTEILPRAMKEGNYKERRGAVMFPAWLDCRDFKAIELPVEEDLKQEDVSAFNKKLSERCSVEPYRN
jgi:hypothetical protein